MQEFPIAPVVSRFLWIIPAVIACLVVVVIAVMMLSMRGARTVRFRLSPDGLAFVGDWYGSTIPLRDLRLADARRVSFDTSPELMPRLRTLGTGLPGYSAGWFRLRNGERALVYLTDRTQAVYVPTTRNYSVLLSPADPDAFLAALTSAARQR
ncbi:MAG: PH domain-containing protein [Acidobacteriaceae bacterium]|jgi:hypothetical protein|nr:PH domain-containing protein [Acidobacteriaceae bacterium]